MYTSKLLSPLQCCHLWAKNSDDGTWELHLPGHLHQMAKKQQHLHTSTWHWSRLMREAMMSQDRHYSKVRSWYYNKFSYHWGWSMCHITGLHIAQIQAIFTLPWQFRQYLDPLAYVKWFTPLRELDPVIGIYQVSHSTRQHHWNAGIIHVKDIIQPCHLVSKIGAEVDHSWTLDSVYELARTFFVNDFIDLDFFFRCSGIQYWCTTYTIFATDNVNCATRASILIVLNM